jgi:putative phosphoribosyl transferase
MFEDRTEAGQLLANRLAAYAGPDTIVLALPRGGVPVGYEVAKRLNAPLDVLIVRKIGAPMQPELALGAIVDGRTPEVVLNDELVRELGISRFYLEHEEEGLLKEIERRQKLYRQGRASYDVKDRTVIVIDDGIATGATVRAALKALRRGNPKRLILAVPVAPPDTVASLSSEVDDLICLDSPSYFRAISMFYGRFDQVSDDEVVNLLASAASDQTQSSNSAR